MSAISSAFRAAVVPVEYLSVLVMALLMGCSGGGDVAPQAPISDAQLASDGESSSEQQPLPVDDQSVVLANFGPEGTSGLTIDGVRYPLNSAIGDVWGPSDDHFQVDFTVTNGNFKIESVIVDGEPVVMLAPADASATFFARVFTPGASFDYASHDAFAFARSDIGKMPGVGYFVDAYVGVDTNEDGSIGSSEKLSVIDGTVSFTGVPANIELNLSVTLSNGQSVTGEYSGLLDYTIR